MAALAELTSRPLRRGVSKYRKKVLGRNAYLAVTSDRQLMHGAVYVVTDDVPDEALVVWLRRELDRVDPAKPRHLQLVRRSVAPAVDGPSPAHPEIARIEEVRRETIAASAPVPWFHEAYPEDHIMRGVCDRLSQLTDSA